MPEPITHFIPDAITARPTFEDRGGRRGTGCFCCGSPIDQTGPYIRAWIRRDCNLAGGGESGWNFHPVCFAKFGSLGRHARGVPDMRHEVLANAVVEPEGE